MFNYKNYVSQLDETDCGAAALSMILRAYKSKVSIAKIRSVAQTDKNGTTALGLVNAAAHFKIDTKVVKASKSFFSNLPSGISLPIIAHVDKDNGLLHYVVITAVHKNYLVVADPDPTVKVHRVTIDEFDHIWTGIAFLMQPTQDYKPQKDDGDSLWATSKILLRQKHIIFVIILATFLSTLITIGGAFFLQQIVDQYVARKMLTTLNVAAISLLVAYLFHGVFHYVQGVLSAVLGQRLSAELLLAYIHHLFKLPLAFFDTRKTGEITSRFDDASNIILTLGRTAVITILNFGTILVIGAVLVCISPKLFLIAMLSFPVYILIILAFYSLFEHWNNETMEQNALLNSQIIESLHGMECIKAFNVENKLFTSIKLRFFKALKAGFKYSVILVTQESLKDFAQLGINLSILYFGALAAIHGQISLGQLVAFNALMGYLLDPIEEIINLQSSLQSAKVANTRLNQILLLPTEISSHENVVLHKAAVESSMVLTLSGVSFEYKYGQKVLRNIDLSIKRHESVAIIGFSGSGKTSLAKLLVGFYRPTVGKVIINGVDASGLNPQQMRNYVTYLPQTPHIFSGSILENITLGLTHQVDMQQVIKAAKVAEIHDDIQELPDGYFTQLSEDSGLSGGQMQRIGIARAVISDTPIIIFDESTSNLDVLTERQVLNNILELQNKTLIFIAHRLEIAKVVDKVIVMDNGAITEIGSHSELLKKRGSYFQLFDR